MDRKDLAALLIALSFFQFGLLQPIAVFTNSQSIIAMSTVTITLVLLVAFQYKMHIYVFFVFAAISLLFLFSYFLFDTRYETLLIYCEFLLKSFSLFLIGSFPFSTDSLKKYFYILSNFNFIALSFVLFVGHIDSIEYMRFGYAMLPTLLVSIYMYHERSKLLNGSILISSFGMILLFGSRGPLIGVILFIFILLFINKKLKIHHKIMAFLTISAGFIYLFLMDGFLQILDFIYFDLGYETYSIIKLRMMIQDGISESSSGRDFLYQSFLELFYENPIFGNGIGITNELWDVTPHNLFLQILVEFGILGMFVFILLACGFLYVLLKIRKVNNELFLILGILFSVSFGRLLVSSDLWLRQEFWLFLSMVINGFLITKYQNSSEQKKFRETF